MINKKECKNNRCELCFYTDGERSEQWSLNPDAKDRGVPALTRTTLRTPGEEESTIDRHPRDEVDIADHVPEIEGLDQAPGTEGERIPVDRRIGSNLHHLSRKLLYQIRAILLVMCQRCIISTRYKAL